MKIIHSNPAQRKEPQNVGCKWLWTFNKQDNFDEKQLDSFSILTLKMTIFLRLNDK